MLAPFTRTEARRKRFFFSLSQAECKNCPFPLKSSTYIQQYPTVKPEFDSQTVLFYYVFPENNQKKTNKQNKTKQNKNKQTTNLHYLYLLLSQPALFYISTDSISFSTLKKRPGAGGLMLFRSVWGPQIACLLASLVCPSARNCESFFPSKEHTQPDNCTNYQCFFLYVYNGVGVCVFTG